MKAMMMIGEWLCALVVILITLIALLLAALINVSDLPRYFRIKSM